MEKFYSNFLDRLGIASITDAQGIITYANEKFCEISQYTKDELVGNTHNLINSGYHERSFFRHMWKTIASGQEWRGELCNKAKDGSLYWVDTFITPQLDENGKPIRFFSFRILITDKKNQTLINEKIRNELHEKNQYLNSILNTQSNFFVIRLALDGTYFYVNDALLKKFEFEPSDIIGQPYSFGIHVDDLGLCQLAAHEALSYPG
ncbi:MAG: PAS domain-containing protein, partial [Cytophagales bacterium]